MTQLALSRHFADSCWTVWLTAAPAVTLENLRFAALHSGGEGAGAKANRYLSWAPGILPGTQPGRAMQEPCSCFCPMFLHTWMCPCFISGMAADEGEIRRQSGLKAWRQDKKTASQVLGLRFSSLGLVGYSRGRAVWRICFSLW